MSSPRPSLDPLRYGLRALGEMSRAQASVPVPAPLEGMVFLPSPRLQPFSREGAALSLKLFSDEEDATRFVLGEDDRITWEHAPARASGFFDAHAPILAWGEEEALVVGLPLVSYVSQGQRRTAPLLAWHGARAVWYQGDAVWKPPPKARIGDALTPPTGLTLRAPDREGATELGLHAGLWSLLLGVDGATLSRITAVSGGDPARLVRAATLALQDDPLDAPSLGGSPLTREDLKALGDAVVARASPRHEVRCHPHGLVMLLPRSDPTMGLRTELDALLDEPPPRSGPLAVFLGASPAPPVVSPLWSHGETPPTPSQLEAARAFEGAPDLVAVRGPPGCGKTALLHHLVAQTVASLALSGGWTAPPDAKPPRWALVITSTNNAAVDHALAPFVRGRGLPVGLRLGNHRTLREVTTETLRATLDALLEREGPTLASARADFEACAAEARRWLAEEKSRKAALAGRDAQRDHARARLKKLRKKLAKPWLQPAPGPFGVTELEELGHILSEHLAASERVAPLHLRGKNSSPARARAKWAEANARRGAVLGPALAALSLALPYRDLGDVSDEALEEALDLQGEAMRATLGTLEALKHGLQRPAWQQEYDELTRAREDDPRERSPCPPPSPDPELFLAALSLREAWARHHREKLAPALVELLARLSDEKRSARRGPLSEGLRALSSLYPVAGCTLLSMVTSFPMEAEVIDRLVIDEAGQCAPLYAVPALARARRALVTGDTAQLPPVYTVDDRVDDRLARGLSEPAVSPFRMGTSSTTSAQAVAEARVGVSHSLVEHFRSQPEIVALASQWSGYALEVRTPRRSLTEVCPWLSRPLFLVPVRGHAERGERGVVNEPEARRAVALVRALLDDGVRPDDVAVLTPFVGQSAWIERELWRLGRLDARDVLVRTVHKLQGGERRVVIFSLTATEKRHLRWVTERPHLLHVAVSRAQDHLIVLLDPDRAREEPALAPLCAIPRPGGRR